MSGSVVHDNLRVNLAERVKHVMQHVYKDTEHAKLPLSLQLRGDELDVLKDGKRINSIPLAQLEQHLLDYEGFDIEKICDGVEIGFLYGFVINIVDAADRYTQGYVPPNNFKAWQDANRI